MYLQIPPQNSAQKKNIQITNTSLEYLSKNYEIVFETSERNFFASCWYQEEFFRHRFSVESRRKSGSCQQINFTEWLTRSDIWMDNVEKKKVFFLFWDDEKVSQWKGHSRGFKSTFWNFPGLESNINKRCLLESDLKWLKWKSDLYLELFSKTR